MSHLRHLAERSSMMTIANAHTAVPPQLLLARALTRRKLLRMMAGASGAALAAGTRLPALAHAGTHTASSGPKPIPGGSFVIDGQLLHVNNLGTGNDQSTIFDFNGFLGATFVLGRGTDGDGNLLGHFVDMRLMEGVYVGLDGKHHQETFAFIWLDIFEDPVDPLSSTQIHDYNPNINSAGVFWTVPVPKDAVEVHQGSGRAVLELVNYLTFDWFDFPNSVTGAIPPEPARVTFRVEWNVDGPMQTIDNPAEDFRFTFRESVAPMAASIEWSAENLSGSGFSFQSEPAANSVNVYASLGRERNGVFYS